MSRPTPAGPAQALAAIDRGPGRHRAGRSTGVRCTELPGVSERLQLTERGTQHRSSFLRWLFSGSPTGRHTWSWLAHSGGRPRTAFAIILSL